ncbi:Sorting nexin-19 [Nymphon striatum]|nr:Sorting nexin-19 [Nymphon striatum]
MSKFSALSTYFIQLFYLSKRKCIQSTKAGVINDEASIPAQIDVPETNSTLLSIAANEEIRLLIKFILKDFVWSWYENLSDNDEFLKEITSVMENSTDIIIESIAKMDKYETINNIIQTYRLFVHEFAKSVAKVQCETKSKYDYSEHEKIIKNFLNSTHHLRMKYGDKKYFMNATSLLLETFCSSKELKSCKFFSNTGFVDVIYKHLIIPLFDQLCDSVWLYEQIIFVLSDDHKVVNNSTAHFPSIDVEDVDTSPDGYTQHIEHRSSSVPSLSTIESLYNERFFNQFKVCLQNSEVCSNLSSEKIDHHSSLPDISKLRTCSLTVDHNLDSSGESAGETTVLFSISSSENLTKFQENAENIKLVFTDVNIPVTEQQKSHGLNQSYTIYCIQYLGWYMVPCSSETTDADGGYFVVDGMRYVQKQAVVRRRFREFVNLQTRLEANPHLKWYLKGIKGPNKYLNSPFSNMAKHTVEQRRVFLQQYLVVLCQTEQICTSTELREFMAYGTNANIAFVNKPRELAIPRLDRMVLRSVSGVFNKFLTALPSLDSPKETNFQRHKKSKSLSFIDGMMPGIDSLRFSVIHSYETGSSDFGEKVTRFIEASKSHDRFNTLLNIDHKVQNVSSKTFQRCAKSTFNEELPLSNALINLAIESFVGQKISSNLICILQILSGNSFEIYLKDSIDELTSDESIVKYLQQFRESFWPCGIFDSSLHPVKSNEEKELIKKEATKVLKALFPGILSTVVGQEQYDNCAEFFIESIQHPELNSFYSKSMEYPLCFITSSSSRGILSPSALQYSALTSWTNEMK